MKFFWLLRLHAVEAGSEGPAMPVALSLVIPNECEESALH